MSSDLVSPAVVAASSCHWWLPHDSIRGGLTISYTEIDILLFLFVSVSLNLSYVVFQL